MKFSYATNSKTAACDLLFIPCFEAANPLKGYDYDKELKKLFAKDDFAGKAGQALVVPSIGGVKARRVCLLGLGKSKDFKAHVLGEALAKAVNANANKDGVKTIGVALDVVNGTKADAGDLGRWIAEGVQLGTYHFTATISKADKKKPYAGKCVIAGKANAAFKAGVSKGSVTSEFTAHARDLVNEPANRINPATLAKFAQDMAKKIPGLTCKVLKKAELKKLKMGAFLGVNLGSTIPAHLIILEYKGGKKSDPTLAFVGKGLTFDAGGYNLKPAAGIFGMKMDMGGGAATIGAMGAIAKLKVKANVVGLVAATENLISGDAFKPGDILTSMSGQTIEIGNTDAEGRLALCDTLTYTQKNYKPKVIVDMATLTGAQIVAVGAKYVAVMGNDDKVVQGLLKSFDNVHENAWELPLSSDYDSQLDSPVADMSNIGGNPGTITAGLFLKRFIEEGQSWAHLDIAGPCMNNEGGYFRLWRGKSATGAPVRALVDFAENFK